MESQPQNAELDRLNIQASLIYFQHDSRQLTILTWNCYYLRGLLDIIGFEFRKFRFLEILNFHQCNY